MKVKRIIALAMAVVMCIALLAACGKEEQTVSVDTGDGYVPTKELELTVWETQGTDYAPKTKIKKNVVEEWLAEKTKVTVENMYGNDGGQWDSKLTKLVAGNNMPDIVHCGAYQGPAHFKRLDELGKVRELTPEILQKYAPDVWARTPKEWWDKMTINGKILGIPYYGDMSRTMFSDVDDETYAFMEEYFKVPADDMTYASGGSLWIRDDILAQIYPETKSYDELVALLAEKNAPIGDELLDVPVNSTEDFIDLMYKIKDLNIKENGKTVYSFGYTGGDNWTALAILGAEMYGYKGHHYTGTWNSVTKRMEIPLAHDLIKQAAKTQTQMIIDRVSDPESLAHTSAQYKEKVMNGQYAIIPLPGTVGINAQQLNDELKSLGKTFRYRPLITNVPAQKEYGAYKENQLWGASLCILNTLSEEEMYQVLNWINVQYTDEFEQIMFWGPESEGLYTTDENGRRVFTDDRFNKYYIDGDTSALPEESDRLGLQGMSAVMNVLPFQGRTNEWNPVIIHRKLTYKPINSSGFRFAKDSVHTQNIATYPPCQVWSAVYAEIPEVVTFWSEREQWESKFKIAMASDSMEMFEQKWQDAIDELNRIVDIEVLENAMTEIARPLAEDIK